MTYTYDTNIFSDFYKDVYGSRPSYNHEFYTASAPRCQQIWDDLSEASHEVAEQEERERNAAVAQFEAEITAAEKAGAGDRATAIRWIMQANDCIEGQDFSCFCWERNIGYGYEDELRAAAAA